MAWDEYNIGDKITFGKLKNQVITEKLVEGNGDYFYWLWKVANTPFSSEIRGIIMSNLTPPKIYRSHSNDFWGDDASYDLGLCGQD
jgi:hypothetical protein